MKRITTLLLLPCLSNAQIVAPPAHSCGSQISRDDVLVLDLESFADDYDGAAIFVSEHTEHFVAANEKSETIVTSRSGTRTNRGTALRLAQRVAAKRGCNVVLVLRAWTNDSGNTFALETSKKTALGLAMLLGYAEVLFGTAD